MLNGSMNEVWVDHSRAINKFFGIFILFNRVKLHFYICYYRSRVYQESVYIAAQIFILRPRKIYHTLNQKRDKLRVLNQKSGLWPNLAAAKNVVVKRAGKKSAPTFHRVQFLHSLSPDFFPRILPRNSAIFRPVAQVGGGLGFLLLLRFSTSQDEASLYFYFIYILVVAC